MSETTPDDVVDLDYALRVADARVAAIRALVSNPRVKFVYAATIHRALDVEPAAFAVPGAAGGQTGPAPAPATTAGATSTERLVWTDNEGTTWGEPIDAGEQRERQGRVLVQPTMTEGGAAAVTALCARCGVVLSGANDALSVGFLLDVGSRHDCS